MATIGTLFAITQLVLCLFCETTSHCSQSLRSLCVFLQVQYCWLLYHVVLVPRYVPFAVCILRFGCSNKFTVDCTVHGVYAAAYFRVPILYCGTVSRSGFSYFVLLTTRFPTKHLIRNFRFTDFQTFVDIRIGLNTRSFRDLNQSF